MNKTATTILAILLAVSVGAIGAYAFNELVIINNGGNIETRYGLSANVTSIEWGTITLNKEYSVPILVTNNPDIVVDCFGGSGSTLIACEQTGRRCFMMEIDPRYCQVIVDRWESYTRQKAEKLN